MIRKVIMLAMVIGGMALLHGCSDKGSSEPSTVLEDGKLSLPGKISAKATPIPKFGEIAHIPDKKSNFFTYLQKRIEKANDYVWAEREFVLGYREKLKAGTVGDSEQKQFTQLVTRYKLNGSTYQTDEDFDALLLRVDVVPASLVLAQGANESAWGTSRFATEGKNFFGIWCYSKGCGLKPKRANTGTSHEVRKFETVQGGVSFYVHNLNIGHAYDSLRAQRAELRSDSKNLSGVKLATGLVRYSERGIAYVEEIQEMIEHNDLSAYNKIRSF
jgi:Bax protein